MAQYIDKSALVAEIEKWIKLLMNEKNQEGASQIDKLSLGGRIAELQEVKAFLDTLEVKEVDLDNELDFVKDAYYYFTSDERSSMKKVAKHFFELGLKATQKGE